MASSDDKIFQRALASLQARNFDDAERLFKRFLDVHPKNVAGLNLFAVLLTQLGKFEKAERYIRLALNENAKSDTTFYNYGIVLTALKRPAEALDKFSQALDINPSVAETWNARGAIFNQLRRYQEAIADFEKAISINSKYLDALCNKGFSLTALQLWDQALTAYDAALALNPGLAVAWHGRGLTSFRLNRQADALAAFDKAIALNPRLADAWLGRGNVLYEFKRYEEAAAAYDKTLALQPDHIFAWIGGGNIFFQLQRHDKALAAYDKALELDANLPNAWVGRGNTLYETKRYDEAIAAYDKALELDADLAAAWVGRGNVYFNKNRDDKAVPAYDKAITLRPDLPQGWAGRAGIFFKSGRDDDALQYCDKAISLDPEFSEPYFTKALIKLSLGNFEEGWPLYERRWQTRIRAFLARSFPQKLWLGNENIAGKTILVHSEQGLGDTIQFYRYIHKLDKLNCQIIFESPAALYELFTAQKPTFRIIAAGSQIPDFDVHCPLMSLPLAFKTTVETIPALVPYLVSPPDKTELWRNNLGKKSRPRIGLCWSGSPVSSNDPWRNIPLESLLPILNENVEWHSLQKDVREHDRTILNSRPDIKDHALALKDFTDTAALIAELDLVISVDAVAAHLTGALGKPLWSVQPFFPDFRWLRGREDSPWYPTARLFRQQRMDDWTAVVGRLQEELTTFVATN